MLFLKPCVMLNVRTPMRVMSGFVVSTILASQFLAAEVLKPIELTIEAQALETQVLKYQLVPMESELKPGNAAPILLRLPWDQSVWMTTIYPKLHEWVDRPLSAPEWAAWNDALPERFYQEMKRAAFRRDAEWEYPIHETENPFMILLPDVQGLRTFLGYGLPGKIRYHMTQGELDKAREGILVGLANARHLARTPFLINQLVALSIDQTMLNQTTELISRPKSPNLYWGLTNLPASLIDLEHAASFEATIFELTLPAVKDLDRPRDLEEWRKMAFQLITLLEETDEIPKGVPPNGNDVEQFFQRLGAPWIRQVMLFAKQGREELTQLMKITPENVAAMSDEEAGIRWYVFKRIQRDQLVAATLTLSPREAWPRLVELRRLSQSLREKSGLKDPEPHPLNPGAVYLAAWEIRRKVAILRVIEAVRHYLATHEGNLPETLNDITNLAIPLDPLTDLPFEWNVKGKTSQGKIATLKSPSLSEFLKSNALSEALTNPETLVNRRNLNLEYRLLIKPTVD